jgi:hypothetical protein
MKTLPITTKTVILILILKAIYWIGFGIAVLTGLHPTFPESTQLRGIMCGLGGPGLPGYSPGSNVAHYSKPELVPGKR